jgi:HPt (histidine-containing phosphotransfer) domain-containing protein
VASWDTAKKSENQNADNLKSALKNQENFNKNLAHKFKHSAAGKDLHKLKHLGKSVETTLKTYISSL